MKIRKVCERFEGWKGVKSHSVIENKHLCVFLKNIIMAWKNRKNHGTFRFTVNIATILWMWITFQSALTVSPSHFQQTHTHSLSPQPWMCKHFRSSCCSFPLASLFLDVLLWMASWPLWVAQAVAPHMTTAWSQSRKDCSLWSTRLTVFPSDITTIMRSLIADKHKRQREKQRNGIEKCCKLYSNLHRLHERHSSCANR